MLDPHINHVIVFPKWISKIGVTQSNPNVSISSVILSLSLFFSLSVFLCFFVWSLLRGLLLANSMAEFSHYFQICSKNSVRKMVLVTGLDPLQGANKINGVCVFFLSPLVWFCMWLHEEVLSLLFLLHCACHWPLPIVGS